MLVQGILPGSLKAPLEFHSKLFKKHEELFSLYKKYFKEYFSADAILNAAEKNQQLASEIFRNYDGQLVFHTGLVPETQYFKNTVSKFIKEAKEKNLIIDILGQGVHGLTLLMEEHGCSVVIKLPINPKTNFEGDGYVALQNEYDHAQKIASLSGINHELVSRPIDQLSIRGKVLAFAKFGGHDLFNRDDYNDNKISAFVDYATRDSFAPVRIAELIKVYMEAYKAQIPTMSYGSPHNTRLIEDGKAIALFDMCSQPPTEEHDQNQMFIQKSLFADNALACALFQTLGNGNINFLLEGKLGTRFRSNIINGTLDRGRSFFEYREKLLRESLEVLLEMRVVTKEELMVNLESLRDVNDRVNPYILDYLKFKDDGRLIQQGQDLAQRLIEYFRKQD